MLNTILRAVFLKQDKTWKFVEGLPINDFSREKMDLTAKELMEEKEMAVEYLSSAWLGARQEAGDDSSPEESKSRLWNQHQRLLLLSASCFSSSPIHSL